MDTEQPKVRSHGVVFEGRVFRIERDELELPGGARTTIDVLRHRGSVVLLPQPTPTQVLLVRQYRHPIGRWIWELPAGTLERDETPEAAARRECAEEVRHAAGRVTRLAALYPSPGYSDELMTFYRLEDLQPLAAPPDRDEDELLEVQTFTLAEARRLLAAGEIADMKTAVGLTLI